MLRDTVFILIDDYVLPMPMVTKEIENIRSISEKKNRILTADSSKVSVIVGYTESKTKVVKISYQIPSNEIQRIKSADSVMFRYYSGPDMITTRIRGSSMRRFRRLIDKV